MTATAAAPVMQITQRTSLVQKFATKFHIEAERLLPILKATAFKVKDGEVSNEQMAALLIVADQYGLNPFTREIFAFPDKQNGIVPVVSVDGWARIVNEHLMMNGFEFRYSEKLIEPSDARTPGLKHAAHEWIECVMHRKDRDRPTVVREFLQEVYRPPFARRDGSVHESAWQTHTNRFLRHKTFIQCARMAFGFAGLFDEDEAERIVEGQVIPDPQQQQEPQRGAAGLKAALAGPAANAEQPAAAAATEKKAGSLEQRDAFVKKFGECQDREILALTMDGTREFTWSEADQAVITEAYSKRAGELEG